jgi:hypothetical protein
LGAETLMEAAVIETVKLELRVPPDTRRYVRFEDGVHDSFAVEPLMRAVTLDRFQVLPLRYSTATRAPELPANVAVAVTFCPLTTDPGALTNSFAAVTEVVKVLLTAPPT